MIEKLVTIVLFSSCWGLAFVLDPTAMASSISTTAITARMEALHNVKASFDLVTQYDVDPKLPTPPQVVQVDAVRTESGSGTWSFLNGSARLSFAPDDRTIKYYAKRGLDYDKQETTIMSGGVKSESLYGASNGHGGERFSGGIENIDRFPEEWTLDLALGLRLYRSKSWLVTDDIVGANELPSSDPNALVLQIQGDGGVIHELHFDRRFFYALVYYKCLFPEGSYEDVVNSNFHRFGNVFVPLNIVRSGHYVDTSGKWRSPIVRTLRVTKFLINDPSNVESEYEMIWPANLRIYDARIRQPLSVGPTSRSLSEDDIREQLDEGQKSREQAEAQARERINQVLGGQPATGSRP
jgi:hypothetical protein